MLQEDGGAPEFQVVRHVVDQQHACNLQAHALAPEHLIKTNTSLS